MPDRHPIGVGVVGVGYWGKNLARNFAELGALVAVADNHAPTAEAVAEQNGVPATDFDAMLTSAAVQGIVVATRAETHFELARRALDAGKHVFVEKPLVLDQGEAELLIARAAAADRVLMVGHLLRYHPAFQRMQQLVASGDYGALRYVYSDRLSLGKIRTEEDVLWSFAPHDLSMILALCGDEPDRVTAQGAPFVSPSISDFTTVDLAFPNGVKASVRASWLHYRKVQQIVAICDTGTIVFEDSEPDWRRKLAVYPHTIDRSAPVPVPVRGEMAYIDLPRSEPLKLECQHFLDCIADGRAPATDGREGLAVLRVLQRATETQTATGLIQ